MENIIIDPGVITVETVKEALNKSPYKAYFIGETFLCDNWTKHGIVSVSFESFETVRPVNNKEYVALHYNEVFDAVINDCRTPQLSERFFFHLKPWQNYFNEQMIISNLVINYMDYIIGINPKFVFFHSTPHNIYSWLFGRVAEIMGYPVYLSKTTALPWRSRLVRGIGVYDTVPIKNNFNDEKVIQSYLEVNSKKYDEAIPSYEKKRLDERKGSFWSWSKELKDTIKRPHRTLAMFKKHSLYKYYQSLASTILPEKFVVVMLHFQPERTSLPEGLNFSQQLHLIRTLRLGLPDDVTILVKEHPSEFVGHFDFYTIVSKMENTQLVDISIDSFSLIDNALSVATITGTVGSQSLIRGTSVMAFGTASYLDNEDCYLIKNSTDVTNAYNAISDTKKEDIHDRMVLYLNHLTENTVCGLESDDVTDYYDQKYRIKADSLVFCNLLNSL